MNETKNSDAELRLLKGDTVQLRSDAGRVGMIHGPAAYHAGIQYWLVFWGGALGTRTHPEYDLIALRGELSAGELLSGAMAGYPEFQRTITLQRLGREQPLKNNIFAFNASRTRFFPYQFKPLLKFLESSKHRLLICDEVGLGKTIEAGLILLELRARQAMRLVLVVCPSNLRPKWKLELKLRFGEEFRILSSTDMHAFLDDYEESPDRATLSGIISLESLRTERLRGRLEEIAPAFDLVILDEAHHVRNFATAQREAVEHLAADAQAMVMLTATPVHLGSENLFSLLNLLDPEDFPEVESVASRFRENEHIVRAQSSVSRNPPNLPDALVHLVAASRSEWLSSSSLLQGVIARIQDDIERVGAAEGVTAARLRILKLQQDLAELNLLGHILTRTRKRDVQQDVAERRARAIEVTLSAPEQRLYDAITQLIKREAERSGERTQNLMWRLNTPQRRLASSLQGMVEFYREKGYPVSEGDGDDLEEAVGALLSVEGARDAELETSIRRLIAEWPEEGPDAKYDHLRAVLRDLPKSDRQQKVLIFASFKHTVRYLKRRLSADGFGVNAISGDVPIEERPAIIDAFREREEVQILVSSRVGSEGLDFQFCSTLVNYDLPWNPMEVEQRIGRLDRIGQSSPTIAIINLWTKGTVEERILKRLYDRIGIFERSVGDLEAILGEVGAEIQSDILRAALNPEEVERATERIARVIERRRKEIQELEASAASFVGVDAFFDEEVAAIRKRRRYITGEQLRMFVMDFVRHNAPRTKLDYDAERQRGILSPDEQLRSFLRTSGWIGDALNIAAAVGESMPVTFDNQVAYTNPRMEFISVLHPLVRAIAEHYETDGRIRKGFQLRCESAELSPGHYFFFVYRLALTAARPTTSLEAVFLDESFKEACDSETAETLLGEMVERGDGVEESVSVSPEIAVKAAATAERAFLGRRNATVELERIENDAFVDKRLASVRSYYGKAMQKKAELLERALRERKQERYIRMLRGILAKLQAEYETKSEELNVLRTVSAEHHEVAIGIVEIVAPAEPIQQPQGRRKS